MSLPEIGYRMRQKVMAYGRRWGAGMAHRPPAPSAHRAGATFVALDARVDRDSVVRAADELLAGRLRIFACRLDSADDLDWNRDPKSGRRAPLRFGPALDYRDESIVGDIKYLWEPNRHLQWVTLAQAYRLTGDGRYAEGLSRQIASWLDQCPYPLGPNWSSALELGIRLINWSLVWQLIGGRASELWRSEPGPLLRARWLEAVYRHQHFIRAHLSRHSSANNHLIGEAAGLFVGAVTWPFWRESDGWARIAREILEREALRQNAPDGVNREQAIAYQQFVADLLLLAALAGRASGTSFSRAYWGRLERMLEFLASLMDVAGHVPMIGDGDDGYAVRLSHEARFCPYRSLLATGAVLFERGDFKKKAGGFDDKSRWLLGPSGEEAFAALPHRSSEHPSTVFPEGGYYILGDLLDSADEVRLVVDAGDLGYERIAAHGHADALAFTLSVAGEEILIDPGTYAYHTHREWRDYFRGTAAHNTVRVDGVDQSVMGGPFMWVRHARAHCTTWRSGEAGDVFVGTHDGYARLADPVIHERTLVLDKSKCCVEVADVLTCAGAHTAERCWHFAEGAEVGTGPGGEIEARGRRVRVRLIPGEPVEAALYRGSLTPRFGWVSRRFDVKTPTTTVVWRNEIRGRTKLVTKILIERQGV